MKKLFKLLIPSLVIVLIIMSCGESGELTEIKGYDKYEDPVTKFSIKYPNNWYVAQKLTGQRISIYTSKADLERFRSWTPEGNPGARIEFYTVSLKDGITIDSVMEKSKMFEKRAQIETHYLSFVPAMANDINRNLNEERQQEAYRWAMDLLPTVDKRKGGKYLPYLKTIMQYVLTYTRKVKGER